MAAGGATAYYLSADTETQMELASATGPLLRMLDPELSHVLGIQVRLWEAGELREGKGRPRCRRVQSTSRQAAG